MKLEGDAGTMHVQHAILSVATTPGLVRTTQKECALHTVVWVCILHFYDGVLRTPQKLCV